VAYYEFKPYNVGRWAVWSLFALVLAVAPLVFRSSLAHTMLSQMGIAIVICLSYNLLLGQGGMLSFGHAVYSGMGAFLAIHALNLIGKGTLPIPVSLVPVVGGLSALAIAAGLGYVTTKKAGTPFAMITLGIGELVFAMSLMFPEFFGGEGGISSNRVTGPKPLGITFGPQIQLYYLIAVYTFICTALMYAFTRTPLGRMLNAVRDNPERVEFVGYDTQKVRWLAFMISGFFAGVAGGLAALNFEIVTSEVVSGGKSGAYLLQLLASGHAQTPIWEALDLRVNEPLGKDFTFFIQTCLHGARDDGRTNQREHQSQLVFRHTSGCLCPIQAHTQASS